MQTSMVQECREKLGQLAPDPPTLTKKKFYHRRSKKLDFPGEIAASKLYGPYDQKEKKTSSRTPELGLTFSG